MVVMTLLKKRMEYSLDQKNVILAISLSIGLGLQAVPKSMQHLPQSLEMLMVSGLLPAAGLAVILNLFLPKEID